MNVRQLLVSAVAVAVLAGATVASAGRSAGDAASPSLPSPADFARRIDNPWFPLRPGTAYIYQGVKDGKPTRERLTVTHETAVIQGVRCTVLHDRLYVHGRLFERTTDWYAQDKHGNVWYLGEATAELDAGGRVTSTEGSWQAGRDGARAGIYMPATRRSATRSRRSTTRATPRITSASSASAPASRSRTSPRHVRC